MDNGKTLPAKLFLCVLFLAALQAWAEDKCCVEMPDPFAPQPVVAEGKGEAWRHDFHKMRHTWENYFDVFQDDLSDTQLTSFDPVRDEKKFFNAASLAKVRANPSYYIDQKVQFDVYFAKTGSFYRPFSPFVKEDYLNFYAWDYGAELWTKEGRANVHPLFYVNDMRKNLLHRIDHLPKYAPIHVWGEVRATIENMPWFEIFAVEALPETAFTDASLSHVELGANQLAKKHYALAAEALEGALELKVPIAAEMNVYSMLGRAYYEERLYCQARNALCNAIQREEGGAAANLVLLAQTDLNLNKISEARQAAEKAAAIEPGNPEARAELGLALGLQGDLAAGYKELDFALKLAPHAQLAEAFRNRAVLEMKDGKPELAENDLSKAVLLRAMDPNLHLELGDVYLTRNKLDSAVLEFRQAKELATQRPEPYYKYALTLKRQADALAKDGKKKEADALYNEALQNTDSATEKDPHFTAAYTLEVEILRALGKEEDAQKVLREHGEANPTPENAAPAAAPEAVNAPAAAPKEPEAKAEKEQARPAEESKPAGNKEKVSKKKAPVIEESEPDALPVEVPGKR